MEIRPSSAPIVTTVVGPTQTGGAAPGAGAPPTPPPATGHSGASSFETVNKPVVNLTGTDAVAGASTSMLSKDGADLALETQSFFEKKQFTPEYQAATWTHDGAPNKPLADQVKADALDYLEKTPGLSAATDKMLAALGPELHPAKVDGWKVDFALAHYAKEGRAAGAEWGASKTAVDTMIDTPPADPPWAKGRSSAGPITQVGTNGREGVTVAAPVSGGQHTVMTADGKNNTIDFCTNPYPSPTGLGEAVLGGSHNKGQVDLTGTIVIRAGDANAWTVKDPSKNAALNTNPSEYKTEVRSQLSANALNARVVLEGNASDWNVRASADTATYTNTRTGTTVTLPADHQARVAYASGATFEKLASDTAAGKLPASPQPGGAPRTGTAPITTPTVGTGEGSAPNVTSQVPVTTTTREPSLEDFKAQLTELLAELLTNELSSRLAEQLSKSLGEAKLKRGDFRGANTLRGMLMKMAGLSREQADKVLMLLGFDDRKAVAARELKPMIHG